MAVIPLMLSLIQWLHMIWLFVLELIALKLMFLVLQMELYLLSMTGRDLQRIPGHNSSKVGYLNMKEIKELRVPHISGEEFRDLKVPSVEDALQVISNSVRQIILDAKVGPPSYEKGLANDILSIVHKAQCKNCLVWAKGDGLVRDVVKQSTDVMAGYIVMVDPKTGNRMNLLRMKKAEAVGVYHPLIDEKVVRILHGRNKKVYAWTVDDVDSMQRMLSEHVDAIVTSNPSLLQRLMQDIRTQCREEGFSLQR
ncbi:glycerophosphodiester phosphodiesterase GDPD4 isoform X2 [Mercurialis annua]|uniref:glycerophosphodiester phosphodiesterase GDPD4 isoform X2 n=1 Tax=Mercurialis annua TaxID=3986 RepID=UPI00215F9DC3|nr:glycerophosphodiester phosphodiesterase GDPD4 isoform X2 [Mercurialis annua]